MSSDRNSIKLNNTGTCDNIKFPESRNGIDRTQLTKCNVSKKLVIKNFGSYSHYEFSCLHLITFVYFYISQAAAPRRLLGPNMGEAQRSCHFNPKLKTSRNFT